MAEKKKYWKEGKKDLGLPNPPGYYRISKEKDALDKK